MNTDIYSRFASNTAVITDDGRRVTYAELADLVTQKAATLPPQVLQFCLCENNLESLVTYLACLEAKAPVVMLDAHKDEALLENLRALYHPGGTVCHPGPSVDHSGGTVCHSDLAVCLTTSGSTGSPKLVRLTLENLRSNAESIAEYLGIDENERAITMLPMYYSYGLSVINSHLLKGATLLLTDKTYAQREFWNFLKDNGATSMAGVPYTWEMLRRLRFFRMDLPSVRTMTQAGGKLNPDLALEYIRNAKAGGKRFIVMYGQTEATARMSYLPWERAEEKYASIGIAIPGGSFELAEDGELIYRGPNVSMGYAECAEDLLKGDENGGVLHTGDLARVDEDGFYYITGRKKRFVKVWGNRCSLDAVEQLLKADEARDIVRGCPLAVAGVDDLVTVFVAAPADDSCPQRSSGVAPDAAACSFGGAKSGTNCSPDGAKPELDGANSGHDGACPQRSSGTDPDEAACSAACANPAAVCAKPGLDGLCSGLEEAICSYLSAKTGLNSRAFAVRVLEAIPVKDSGKIDYQKLQSLL